MVQLTEESMASGLPAVPTGPAITVVTEGYDWTVSAKKYLKHATTSMLGTVATFGGFAVLALLHWGSSTDNLHSVLGDSVLAKILIPALAAGFLGAADNWLKHRNDPPMAISAVPLSK